MTTARIELPPRLIPVFDGEADVRGAYGGRGSGKTRSFAKMSAVRAYMWAAAGRNGQVLCGRQFMKTLADSSLEEVKQAILETDWLKPFFDIGETYIRTVGLPGEVYYTFMGLDRNIDSVKSQARILLGWVDEAEPVTDEAWTKLIPTLREEDSELWVTWNPERKNSPTHKRFRESKDPRYKVVELNFRDNPRFPAILERQRQRDMRERPDQYSHIWEGDFVTAVEGAYFAQALTQAKADGRIGRVPADPLMTIRAFADIGGTGARADAFVFVIAQFIGKEVRILDHYEVVGQPAAAHVNWLRSRGYTPDKCQIWLPHDGATQDRVHDASYEGFLRQAGYTVTVVANQGKGAAMARIEALRRLFPSIWFNEATTEGLRDALGWYHEKKDEDRGIGLGPEHDWASHSCFRAGTLVETVTGPVPIENIQSGDYVVTPAGPSRVTWAGEVKKTSELIRLKLSDGREIVSTPDHGYFTTGGVVPADAIGYNDFVLTTESKTCINPVTVSKMGYRDAFIESFKASSIGYGKSVASTARNAEESRHSFTAFCSLLMMAEHSIGDGMLFPVTVTGKTSAPAIGVFKGAGRTVTRWRKLFLSGIKAFSTTQNRTGISKPATIKVENISIEPYGSMSADLSLTGIISTISTRIRPTTGLKIWNLCLRLSTRVSTHAKALGLVVMRTSGNLLASAPRLLFGIGHQKAANGIASTPRNPRNGTLQPVKFAVGHMKRRSPAGHGIAAGLVSRERLVVESEPVFDLTVEHHHCYFANGVLVSNCDAAGLLAVAYEEPKKKNDWAFAGRKVV